MSNRDVREHASSYFLPLLLGNNSLSHKLSAKILRKYGVESLILDEKRSAYDILDVSSHFVKLSQTQEPTILSDELLAIAKSYEYTLPILVPCSEKYIQLIATVADELEAEFVICDADEIFTSSPLSSIP